MKLARSAWAPLALAVAWLAATLWARPLAVPDEGRYVGVAWGMLTSGDWVVPRLDGLPFFHKPPLFYWITGGAMALFGPHEWAARIAPFAGSVLGTGALFLFARRRFGERQARLALLALATQPLFFLGSQYANLDMLVAGCIAATVLAFAHAALLLQEGRPAGPALAAGYLCAALGVLSKGLIGVVLPGLVLATWLVLSGRWRTLPRLVWLPGAALFLLVAAPWFLAMQQRFPEFAHYFFVVQHFSRFTGAGFNNQQPWYFYPVVLVVLALPWSAWMLSGARRRLLGDPGHGTLRLLLWVWLLAIVGFFSLPSSKLVGYVFPAAFPLALLAADAFARHGQGRRGPLLWWIGGVLAGVVCVVAVTVLSLQTPGSTRKLARALEEQLQPGDQVLMLHGYAFDLLFNAHLRAPVVVVEDWDDPAIIQRDNWRKELADAGRFAPAAAHRLLRLPADLPGLYCTGQTTWILGGTLQPAAYAVPTRAQLVAVEGDRALWRLPGVNRAGCSGTPSESSGDKS